jgi:hypothetical protein
MSATNLRPFPLEIIKQQIYLEAKAILRGLRIANTFNTHFIA